ncbi:MAG: MFS transporter [Thermodesulfobacteriota bacterium]
MPKPLPSRSVLSFRTALSLQYFLYFGVMGVMLPYFTLYLYRLGLSGEQIGVVAGIRSLLAVAMPLCWGALADRSGNRRSIFIGLNIAATACFSLFFHTESYGGLIAVMALWGIFYTPIISFMEAFSMEVLGKDRRRYGSVRVWGSLSFITCVLSVGALLNTRPVSVILVLIFIGSAAQAALSPLVPAQVAGGSRERPSFRENGAYLLRGRIPVFLLCAFLMLASHGAYYGFFSIRMENLGFGGRTIGLCWAVASIAEISVMLLSGRIFSRFSPEKILQMSLLVAVVRWTAQAFASTLTEIILVQILHAATYGAFHVASILFIEQNFPEKGRTLGQAANNAATYGLGLAAGVFLSGVLFDSYGAAASFLFCGALAGTAALVFYLIVRR